MLKFGDESLSAILSLTFGGVPKITEQDVVLAACSCVDDGWFGIVVIRSGAGLKYTRTYYCDDVLCGDFHFNPSGFSTETPEQIAAEIRRDHAVLGIPDANVSEAVTAVLFAAYEATLRENKLFTEQDIQRKLEKKREELARVNDEST